MQTRLGGADRNVENGCGFLERKIVLVVKQEDCSAGGRDVVEKREEGGIGPLAKVGSGSESFGWKVVEGLPAVGAFQVADCDPRGDSESPGREDRRLAQERELAENLD